MLDLARVKKVSRLVGRLPNGCMAEAAVIDRLAAQGISVRRGVVLQRDIGRIQVGSIWHLNGKEWVVFRGSRNGDAIVTGARCKETLIPFENLWDSSEGKFLEPLADGKLGETAFRLLIKTLAHHKWAIVATNLLAVSGSLVGIYASRSIGRLVDIHRGDTGTLVAGLVGLGILLVIQSVIVWLNFQATTRFALSMGHEVMGEYLAKALRIPFGDSVRMKPGQFGFGANAAKSLAENQIVISTGLAAVLLQFVLGVVFVGTAVPLAGVIIIGFSVILASGQLVFARKRQRLLKVANELSLAHHGFLSYAIHGAQVIKAHGVEQEVLAKWRLLAEADIQQEGREQQLGIASTLFTSFGSRLCSFLALLGAAVMVSRGQVGLGTALFVLQQATIQIQSVVSIVDSLALAALTNEKFHGRVWEVVSGSTPPPEPDSSPEGRPCEVEFRNVCFSYGVGEPNILENVSFLVRPGERHWLKTPSGSGKTTLLRLIAGLYPPTQGRVLVGGIDAWRRPSDLMYLPQGMVPVSGNILGNLKAISRCNDVAKLKHYAELTGLDEFVSTLPMGYETNLHSGGLMLSGGQRQLLGITGALASECQLILLDEAMANIDWQLRPRIAGLKEWEGKTLVFASHDPFFAAAR